LRMTITGLQKRILSALMRDDLVWEVAGSDYFTQFNEKTAKQTRIRLSDLDALQELGWVERVWHDPASHKLDYWQLTPAGRTAVESFLKVVSAPSAPVMRALSA
jgi:hypothetical protein